MSARVRVLFAIPQLDRDGPDRVMFELLCGLDRSRFAPSLLVSEPQGHYLSRLPADVDVVVLGHQHSLATRYPLWRALRAVRQLAPDVVFSTLRMNTTLGLVAPAFRRGTRFIIRQANDFTADFSLLVARSPIKHRVSRAISRATLRGADAVVCQSLAMRDDLERAIGGATPLHVIHNPVDVARARRAGEARRATPRGTPALVSVGRLMPQKGFDLLLPAIAELRARHPALHLTIFGDGPDRTALERQRDELGLRGTVTFAGFSTDILPEVRAASLFVLASRYEGFPNAALEALACGTPVVLTDCPGANVEIVRPGINGRLASAIEPGAVARALDEAIAELPRYDREAIVADTASRFAADQIVREYERVLAGALA